MQCSKCTALPAPSKRWSRLIRVSRFLRSIQSSRGSSSTPGHSSPSSARAIRKTVSRPITASKVSPGGFHCHHLERRLSIDDVRGTSSRPGGAQVSALASAASRRKRLSETPRACSWSNRFAGTMRAPAGDGQLLSSLRGTPWQPMPGQEAMVELPEPLPLGPRAARGSRSPS